MEPERHERCEGRERKRLAVVPNRHEIGPGKLSARRVIDGHPEQLCAAEARCKFQYKE